MFEFDTIAMYRPVLPVVWLVLLLAAAVATAAWRYMAERRAGLLALRVAAIAAVGWVLAGPSVLEHGASVGERDAVVTLLVDTSASMGEADVGTRGDDGDDGGAAALSRWQALRETWLSDAQLDALRAAGWLRVVAFDERVRLTDAAALAAHEPTGRATHLFAALDEAAADPALCDDPAPVFVLLSDGHDTQRGRDPAVLDRLAGRGATVHVVTAGEPDASPRLAVQAWADADVLFDGETTRLHAQLWQRGLAGRVVEVSLYDGGELLASRQVRVSDDAIPEPMAFEVSPRLSSGERVAWHDYEVRAELVDDGSDTPMPTLANSAKSLARQQVFVQVSRERMRVALLEGEPYWETRWLARVLRDDPQVELHAAYHLGSGRRIVQRPADASPHAPRLDVDDLDADTLAWFDVIVLGKRAERFFPGEAAGRLVDFVRDAGGAVVLARGRPFDITTQAGEAAMAVFDPIAPVTWGEQQVADLTLRLTPEGEASSLLQFDGLADRDVLTTRLPGMIAATRIERERAASVVLLRQATRAGAAEGAAEATAEGAAMAAVVQMRAGRGRVMAMLTDGLWRWAMLPNELRDYDTVYHQFWSRAVRWLARGDEFLPGQDVSLSLDRLAVEPGEPVTVTASTRHVAPSFQPRLCVADPAGERHVIELRRADRRALRFHATYRSERTGVHRFELDAPDSPDLIDPATPLVARLVVEDRSPEHLDAAARPSVMREIARATIGHDWAFDDDPAALLDVIRDRALAREPNPQPRYAFARWPVLAWIVFCLTLEWWLRRRAGGL